jgi:hypothetical protein
VILAGRLLVMSGGTTPPEPSSEMVIVLRGSHFAGAEIADAVDVLNSALSAAQTRVRIERDES